MKRRETLLEHKLIENGYKLVFKTYKGKKSEKVDNYVFSKLEGETEFIVCLNKDRNEITCYYFKNDRFAHYDLGKIEGLRYVYEGFENFLKSIYDFKEKRVLE